MNLQEYIYEELSNANVEKLTQYVNDDNIDEIIGIISKHNSGKLTDEKIKQYTEFFKKHGILNLNWGRKNGALKQFVQLFNENNNMQALDTIINNDGVVSISKLQNSGNIFDYCKINVDGKTIDWSDEARTISTWVNSKSASAGPAEMLLKFMLIEGGDKETGDVGIRKVESETVPSEEMEVKAATLKGNKTGSGGHAAGQRGDIRKTWAIYHYLNVNLLHLDSDNAFADKCEYFQNDKGIQDFNVKITEANVDEETVIKTIVDALCFQYNYITNEQNAKNTLATISGLYDAALKFAKDYTIKKGFTRRQLLDLVGCIQLYLYSQVEQFNYFICILIDKNDDNTNPKNGFYVLFTDCGSTDTKLFDFDYICQYLYFGQLDSTTSSQGRTGKIYIKK